MIYKPCTWCKHNPCGRCAEIRTAIRGLRLTQLTVKCGAYKAQFTEGQRVMLPVWDLEDGEWGAYEDGPEGHENCAPGTVVGWKGNKVMVYLDYRDGWKNPVICAYPKSHHGEVLQLDEPTVTLCPMCKTPEGRMVGDGHECFNGYFDDDIGEWIGQRCLAKPRKAETVEVPE